ncbi:hypothetical protein HDV57DRAFT_404664 [Trichoderma longibrachiatum]
MDEERRSKIAAALQQYRQTVSQHNLAMLRILVDGLEARPLPPRAECLRLRALTDYYLRIKFPESVKRPQDIFNDDVRAKLIRQLDGVCNRSVHLTRREEYFASLGAKIAEKNIDVVEFPPADLEYLCTLVDGIDGPGLPYYTVSSQIEFITPAGASELDGLKDSIIVPAWDDAGDRVDVLWVVWKAWEIAVAFVTGKGPFALCGSCAIYCSHKEDDANKEWKWRYGIFDGEWCSDLYNSVEEFLGFYAHHNEQTEEMVRRDVWDVSLL